MHTPTPTIDASAERLRLDSGKSRQERRQTVQNIEKALNRFVKVLAPHIQRVCPGLQMSVSNPSSREYEKLYLEAAKLDSNYGVPYPGGSRTIAELLAHSLEDKYAPINNFLASTVSCKPLHLATSPTQTTKSCVQQVFSLLCPFFEYVITGIPVYPIPVIPPPEKHGRTMADELRMRAAILTFLRITFKKKTMSLLEYYRDVLGITLSHIDSYIIRTHAHAKINLDSIINGIEQSESGKYRLCITVDEAHVGSAFDGIYPQLLKSIKVETSTTFITATPTEFMDREAYGKIHHVAGWVDTGYRHFYIGNREGNVCYADQAKTIPLYRIMPKAQLQPIQLEKLDDYCRQHFGLGAKQSLEPEAHRTYVPDERGKLELVADESFRGLHLTLLLTTISKMLQTNNCILIRVGNGGMRDTDGGIATAAMLEKELSNEVDTNNVKILNLAPRRASDWKKFGQYRTMADIQDHFLHDQQMKVVVLVAERCKMAHRYSKHIDIAIDLAPAYHGDEAIQQSLAARLTKYDPKQEMKTILLLTNIPKRNATNGSYDIHRSIQQTGRCIDEERYPSIRCEDRLEDGEVLFDQNKTTCQIWWDEWSDDSVVQKMGDTFTRIMRKYVSVQANNTPAGPSKYFNESVLSLAVRSHLRDITLDPIANEGDKIRLRKKNANGDRTAPKGNGGWAYRFGTKESFTEHSNSPTAKHNRGGAESKNTLVWCLDDNMQYSFKTVPGRKFSANDLYRISQCKSNSRTEDQVLQKKIFGHRLSERDLIQKKWFLDAKISTVGVILPLAKIDSTRGERILQSTTRLKHLTPAKSSFLEGMIQ